MHKSEKKTVCSRCETPMIVMYHPEFVYTGNEKDRILLRPEALKEINLCTTCCNQLINNILIDDVLEKIIMFRETSNMTLAQIGEIVHKNRDELSKKYSKYLNKAVRQLSTEEINKMGALFKAGWSVKDIYYEFGQKISLDIIAKVVTGKMWKNHKKKGE